VVPVIDHGRTMRASRSDRLARSLCLGLALVGADGAAKDGFGLAVAIDGDTAVVGAPGVRSGRGAVYVFDRVGNVWTQTGKLTATNTLPDAANDNGNRVGTSVAIHGDTIVAGAPGTNIAGGPQGAGAVYTFTRTGTAQRTQTSMLTVSDAAAYEELGDTVAIDGETVVAGAPCADIRGITCAGALFTFPRQGTGQRTESGVLFASDAEQYGNLGKALAIDGDTIAAGATRAVYTFATDGAPAQRAETAKLIAPDAAEFALFGYSVAIEGDTIASGAPQADVAGRERQGAVYTFARTGAATREPTAKLIASDGSAHDFFGSSVAIGGTILVPGARAVYGFERTGGDRGEVAKQAFSGNSNSPVAVEGDTIVAGVPDDTIGGRARQGSVSFFFPGDEVNPDPPDTAAPVLDRLRLSPARFMRVRGTRIRYRLSEDATVLMRIQRIVPGRTPKTLRGSFFHKGRAGSNSLRFSGYLAGRPLAAGRYRLVAKASDRSGNVGTKRRAAFRITGR
jgi:hypothetical protein